MKLPLQLNLKIRKYVCSILAASLTLACAAVPAAEVSAKESVGNGIVLSMDSVTITQGEAVEFTAVIESGLDASRLACIVADPNTASITPVTYAANAAAFRINYAGAGSTVAAVYHMDNPAVVAYLNITTAAVTLEIPPKLGTNRDNYCKLTSYEFVPYDFTYLDFNDYKATLNIKYQCAAYNDDEYGSWGCYGYFYDAEGNVLSKVHLYAGTMLKGRVYHSEFNVPVNAVRFKIEGFN